MLMSDSRIVAYLQKLGYSLDGAMAVIQSPNRKYVEEQLVNMESFIRSIRKDSEIDPVDVLFQNKNNQSLDVEVVSKRKR